MQLKHVGARDTIVQACKQELTIAAKLKIDAAKRDIRPRGHLIDELENAPEPLGQSYTDRQSERALDSLTSWSSGHPIATTVISLRQPPRRSRSAGHLP